jgi:protein-tyrosine-phosphatase
MAAALAAAVFERGGLKLRVNSAGVSAYDGSSASQNAILAMELEELDLSAHKSRSLQSEIIKDSALVLTMTRAHLKHVKAICPDVKAFTLGEYAGASEDVSDPFGGSLDEYRNCAAQIKRLLEACVERLRGEV